jgi:hypothetical protein
MLMSLLFSWRFGMLLGVLRVPLCLGCVPTPSTPPSLPAIVVQVLMVCAAAILNAAGWSCMQ